jgi:hypothetical protein
LAGAFDPSRQADEKKSFAFDPAQFEAVEPQPDELTRAEIAQAPMVEEEPPIVPVASSFSYKPFKGRETDIGHASGDAQRREQSYSFTPPVAEAVSEPEAPATEPAPSVAEAVSEPEAFATEPAPPVAEAEIETADQEGIPLKETVSGLGNKLMRAFGFGLTDEERAGGVAKQEPETEYVAPEAMPSEEVAEISAEQPEYVPYEAPARDKDHEGSIGQPDYVPYAAPDREAQQTYSPPDESAAGEKLASEFATTEDTTYETAPEYKATPEPVREENAYQTVPEYEVAPESIQGDSVSEPVSPESVSPEPVSMEEAAYNVATEPEIMREETAHRQESTYREEPESVGEEEKVM